MGNDHPGLTANVQQIDAILEEAERSEFNYLLNVHFLFIYILVSQRVIGQRRFFGVGILSQNN